MKLVANSETKFTPAGNMVERAIALAVRSHQGQKRKDGTPYILHPLAVMLRFRDTTTHAGDTLRAAAVLHDVVEDCGVSVGSIVANIDPEVGEIVDQVSRRPDELYADFIVRAGSRIASRLIKIADLEDNLATIDTLEDKDEAKSLRRRYEWALGVLK